MKTLYNFLFRKFFISRRVENFESFNRALLIPKHVSEDGNIPDRKLKDYFLPNSDGGVSINRNRYANEDRCKNMNHVIRGYTGFMIFDYEMVCTCIEKFKQEFPNEQSPIILATPLDEHHQIITKKYLTIFENRKGNSSHADIRHDEVIPGKPNNNFRKFARLLAEVCIKEKDPNIHSKNWTGSHFDKLLSEKKAA